MVTHVIIATNRLSKTKDIKCAMENLIKLLNDWEIQLLVLLSFTIQVFLFFTGGLRRRGRKMLLRFLIWMAYLGADLVAVYALGYLSRHVDATIGNDTLRGTHSLALFWAPFLLIHLGGQDTITAFSMEDNSLWLRHLLNMVVQVALCLYVFWNFVGKHSMKLLVSGIFVFVAGVIKYGERVWSLKCGSLESLKSSTGNQYKHHVLELTDGDVRYSRTVCTGLHSMLNVLNVITERSLVIDVSVTESEALSLVDIELGILYNDLYTKSLVTRTRIGIILRLISQIAAVAAFMMFLAGDRHGYNGIDVAITYSLFIGGFFIEVCAVFNFMMSPWTWAWLKARGCDMLACLSWCLFSNGVIGWKRPWSTVMGQYNLRGWLVRSDKQMSFSQQLFIMVRRLATLFGAEEEKLFWLNKLLFREYAKADETMRRLLLSCARTDNVAPFTINNILDLIRDHPWYNALLSDPNDFGHLVVLMHILTEEHLSKHSLQVDATSAYTELEVQVCLQLSRYMMYLLTTQPSLLPLNKSPVATLDHWQAAVSEDGFMGKLESLDPPASAGTLHDIQDMWMWLITYAAAKSRPEMHAALIARGGEPLTYVWLLLAHKHDGESTLPWYRELNLFHMFTGRHLVCYQLTIVWSSELI